MTDSLDHRNAETMDVIGGLVTGQLSREEFIRRAGMLGFSMTAIGAMLAAAGKAAAGELGIVVDHADLLVLP